MRFLPWLAAAALLAVPAAAQTPGSFQANTVLSAAQLNAALALKADAARVPTMPANSLLGSLAGGTSNVAIVFPNCPTGALNWTNGTGPGCGSGGGGSVTLTGSVTGSGIGTVPTVLAPTGVASGSYTNPNITVGVDGRISVAASGTGGSASTTLTGPVTGTGTGTVPTAIAATGVSPGSYTNANVTIGIDGRITGASNGTGGGANTLTGPVTGTNSGGTIATTITPTAVAPGSYTNASLTVGADGRLTAASSGSGSGGGASAGAQFSTQIASTGGGFAAVAPGTAGQILTSAGAAAPPTYAAPPAAFPSAGPANSTQIAGAGGAFTAVPPGTSGQVLISNGTGAPPAFADPLVSQPTASLLNATVIGGATAVAASCASGQTSDACLRQLHADMITGVSAPGTGATSLIGVQGGGATALPVLTLTAPVTPTALSVSTITTGGTAYVAVAAGQRKYGGFIMNPAAATEALCINEITTASGTSSSGSTICIAAGNSYNLAPSANAVSVTAATTGHVFAGLSYN